MNEQCTVCAGDHPSQSASPIYTPCTCPEFDGGGIESYDYLEEECHDSNDHDIWEWALNSQDLDAYEWNDKDADEDSEDA